jgi:hypothetical protein
MSFWLVVVPLGLAVYFLRIWKHDISIPFYYDKTDAIWQFSLTKTLLDTGWISTNPYLGAPSFVQWYNNPAAQASALHSVIMWIVGLFAPDAVATQQYYYILNFSLITITSYIAARLIGIDRIWSVCVGLLFAFLPGKFNMLAYAFLSNYFTVPLSVVPAIWTLQGRFADLAESVAPRGQLIAALRAIALSRLSLISLASLVLAATADGYYAFFALLLLGLATALRALLGDLRRPLALVAPACLMVAIVGTALLVLEPVRAYQNRHPEEFAPHGVADPTFARHSFEASMYSSSIMVLLAPSDRHRIPAIANIGRDILSISNQARAYPTSQWAPLGTLGSILFVTMLAEVAKVLARGGVPALPSHRGMDLPDDTRRLLGAIAVLSLFVLGCSIFGGFGAIIALLYPTIRAYERFPIFLSFLLFCGAGVVLTALLRRGGTLARRVTVAVGTGVTLLALFDQAPYDIAQRSVTASAAFQLDRRFVERIEAALPDGAMVYQDPYSNYLTNNRYYGWGSFADMRFYLHSRHLRWSSGASKNTPIDQWHERLAELPPEQLLTEVEAVGFRGFLVDRTVVPDSEYGDISRIVAARTSQPPLEDAAAGLAFWTLPDPGYRLEYAADFVNPARLVVSAPAKLATAPLSRLLRRETLLALLATAPAGSPLVIERATHPEIFRDATILDRGMGLARIASGPTVAGDVSCPADAGRQLSVSHDSLDLRITNRSEFDWFLNRGPFPLGIGMMQLLTPEGGQLRWDGGFRVPGIIRVSAGESRELSVPLASLDMHTNVPDSQRQVTAVFALVQDGNAWYAAPAGNGECRVTLVR